MDQGAVPSFVDTNPNPDTTQRDVHLSLPHASPLPHSLPYPQVSTLHIMGIRSYLNLTTLTLIVIPVYLYKCYDNFALLLYPLSHRSNNDILSSTPQTRMIKPSVTLGEVQWTAEVNITTPTATHTIHSTPLSSVPPPSHEAPPPHRSERVRPPC